MWRIIGGGGGLESLEDYRRVGGGGGIREFGGLESVADYRSGGGGGLESVADCRGGD